MLCFENFFAAIMRDCFYLGPGNCSDQCSAALREVEASIGIPQDCLDTFLMMLEVGGLGRDAA